MARQPPGPSSAPLTPRSREGVTTPRVPGGRDGWSHRRRDRARGRGFSAESVTRLLQQTRRGVEWCGVVVVHAPLSRIEVVSRARRRRFATMTERFRASYAGRGRISGTKFDFSTDITRQLRQSVCVY